MKPSSFTALFLAGCTAALALAGSFGLGHVLSRQAASQSHALPRPAEPMVRSGEAPRLAERGKNLYLQSCAHCHGNDARGDEGPDLHDLQASDRRIATVIKRGIKGEMPSFAKKHGDPEIVALIAYLRTLG